MYELAAKAQEGSLAPDEEKAVSNYERAGTLLAILKSRARNILKRTGQWS